MWCRVFGRGEGIRTPGPMLPKHVRYQTALHPGFFIPRGYFPQATKHIIHDNVRFVNTFFKTFFTFFRCASAVLPRRVCTYIAAKRLRSDPHG